MLKAEKLRLKVETRKHAQPENGEQLNQGLVETTVKRCHCLLWTARNNLNKCIMRFQRYADVVKWDKQAWDIQLSS